MKGKSQIFSLEKSLFRITGHWAIKACIFLIPLPQEWPGLENYVLVNFFIDYQMFPDIQTVVSNFRKNNLGKLYDRPKHEQKNIRYVALLVSKIFRKFFAEQNLRLTKWAKIERLFFVFLI